MSRAEPARDSLFWLGILSMFNCGLAAAARASVAGDLKHLYLDPISPTTSAAMIGEALGIFFLGFTIALLVLSVVLDRVGMGRMMQLGGMAFVVSTLLLLSCPLVGGMGAYRVILAAMFINGVGHASIEGTVNPMVAALYGEDVTGRMNRLHAWYPGGLIAGGAVWRGRRGNGHRVADGVSAGGGAGRGGGSALP